MKPFLRLTAVFPFAFAIFATGNCRAEQAIISEIHYNPLQGQPEYVEIYNNSGAAVDFARWQFTKGIDYEFPDFSSGDALGTFMHSFERIVVASVDEATLRAAYTIPADTKVFGPWIGALSNAGERLRLENKNGVVVCDLTYNDGGRKWPLAPDGTGHALRLINPNQSCSDWRNWTGSAGRNGTPGAAPASDEGVAFSDPEIDLASNQPIVQLEDTWRYNTSGDDLGTAWREPAYDDSSWSQGRGIFGRESKTFPDPGLNVNQWPRGLVTYYLRTSFDWNGGITPASITINAYLDDGAVYYLNGQEIGRTRLTGVVDYLTEATASPQEVFLEEGVVDDMDISGLLVQGTNTLAVEVHNESAGSSDIVFGPQVFLTAPPGGAIINEVLPGPAGTGFIEFYNPFEIDLNLRDHYLSDDPNNLTKFPITADSVIPAGGLGSLGFTESGFTPGAQTTVYLTAPDGSTMQNALDAALGLDGKSLGRKPSGATNWFLFDEPSRDELNVNAGDLSSLLALNEAQLSADGSAVEWVEVKNLSASAVPVGGLFLASETDFSDAVPLNGTIGSGSISSWELSFPLDLGEVRLFLITGGGVIIDAVELIRTGAEVNFQRDLGSKEWYRGPTSTRDAANSVDRITDIVINEIMADPPSDEHNGEYVELYNRGSSPVDLTGWKFVDGINFDIPAGTTIAPGGYLVIAANASWINSVYGINAIGDFGSTLANQGELLRLEDSEGDLADEVDYRVGGDWPTLANGDGSSLELAHPDADNDLPTSWKDSDETTKSTFQNYSFTSTYSHFSVPRRDKELWMHLVGDAHIVLKDIQLKRNGSNILQNHTLIAPGGNSNGGWLAQGTHHASHFQGNEFHLISDGHGDNRVNRIELQVDAMNGGDELTYEFQARWVMGKPRLIVKTFEDSFVGTFRLEIPNDLGTPGAANSILAASPPTGLGQLQHSPAVPSTADNVRISARVASAPAPTSMEIVYRQDTSGGNGTWQTTAMNDSGTGGDTSAGDGIWSGQITDQKFQARIVQFYVRSTAPGGVQSFLPARGAQGSAMYVVDDDVPEVDVTTYRYVYSAYDARAWASGSNSNATYDYKFPHLSNSYKNMTLVVDESEVYYNCEVRPSGSPWHAGSRTSLNQRGKWRMPKDNRFRGLAKLSFDNTPAAEGAANIFNNKVPRQILYLMGHETSENEFATIITNADTPRNSVEIFEVKGNDFLKRNFGPDGSQGELFRADDIFFFNDSNSKDQITNRHWWYAGDDWPGPARYHSQWLLRSKEADYDYSALINMLDTVQGGSNYTQEEIDRLVNAQRICMVAAVRGYIGDWDSFTLNRPKNIFFYRPPGDGKFQFLFHDSDLAFQNANETIVNGGSAFRTWINKPYNRRIFRYYLAEVLDKWQANGARMDAWFDCEDSVSSTYNPNQSKYTSWDSRRRARAQSELGANYTKTLSMDPISTTGDDVISITGEAGYRVWEVSLTGHPEATFTWLDETNWRIDGIVLESGDNSLQIVGLDDDGNPAFGGNDQLAELTVNKTSDGAPLIVIDASPKSQNVSLAETFVLDPGASYDPEGGALTFEWIAPPGVSAFNVAASGVASANFDTPGLYEFTVTATDPQNSTTSLTIEAAVYGPTGFSTFGEPALEPHWELFKVEPLDNSSPGAWYSLGVEPGRLTLQLPMETTPLGLPQPELPDPQMYLDFGDIWNYDDSNDELTGTFAQPGFDDSAWLSGPGYLGFNQRGVPAPGLQTSTLRRDNDNGLITYYFRTEFEFGNDPVGAQISLDHIVDDGVRYYLNGHVLGNVRLPSGAIDSNTLGTHLPIENVVEEDIIVIDGSSSLVVGTNVLAAEVHNESAGSSDLVFGARVDIASRELAGGGGGPSLDGTIHPWIKRDLPTETDWVLQTDLELTSVQFGEFITGLMVEVERGGQRFRYAFGYQDGEELAVAQIGPTGTTGTFFSRPYSEADNVTLRIRREGDVLFFDWQPDVQGVWENLFEFDLGAGSTTLDGGVFAATEELLGLRVSFDYLMLIDPNSTSQFAGDIVISEVMYKPLGGPQHEYIELYNAGAAPVNLNGFRFPEGSPVAEFIFGEVTLEPGAYLLVVSDESAFLEHYGAGLEPLVAGAWTGSNLSNSGEEIILLDADGMVVASFIYRDLAPWPTEPDNNGTSLVPIAPSAGNSSDGSQWRASTAVGGSPGAVDLENGLFAAWMAARGETDPLAVKEGEALNNLLTYGFGVDLARTFGEAIPIVGTTESGGQTYLTLSHRRRLGDPSLRYEVELSRDLATWADAAGDIVELAPPTAVGDGTELVQWRTVAPVSSEEFCALRVRVTVP